MQRLTCQQCQASLNWDGQSPIVTCEYCGTRYQMHPRQGGASTGVTVGVGEVSPLQTSRGQYAGRALIQSFVPKGWKVTTNAPEQQANLLVPLTLQVLLEDPSGEISLLYTGARAYNHLDYTPQTAAQQGQIAHPDWMIPLAYRDAAALCDGTVAGNGEIAEAKPVRQQKDPDQLAGEWLRKELASYQNGQILQSDGSWCRTEYAVKDRQGKPYRKAVEAMVTYAVFPVPPQEQMLYQMLQQTQARAFGGMGLLGGLMGGRMNAVQPPQPKLRWIAQYVLEVSAAEGAFPRAMEVLEQVRRTIQPLPLFHQETERLRQQILLMAQQESGAINDALSQMNRDRMASWDRQQNIIQSTHEYTTGVMRQMQQDNAATMDRVNNLRSEAIRGVNTYYTAAGGPGDPRVVEADIGWDHVYQNTQHPDWYAASTGEAPLEFGVDYEELKQTHGDY